MKNTIIILLGLLICGQAGAQSAKKRPTAQEYSAAFSKSTELGFKIDMAKADFLALSKDLKPSDVDMGFREEYDYHYNKGGLQNITFYLDKDNHQPLYEVIFEFENADTLEILCQNELGPANHPRLDEHWIFNLTSTGLAVIMWRFENKLVMAANLPQTEMDGEYTFQFDQEFIDKFIQEHSGEQPADTPANNAPAEEELITQLFNSYIAAAQEQFASLKGDAVPGKKDEFYSNVQFYQDDLGTLIRKKANENWRLEVKISSKQTLEQAKTVYNSYIELIQKMEALEYHLIKKSEYATNTSNTYIWNVENLDGDALGTIIKMQLYAAGEGMYSVRLEIGN